MPTWKRSSPPPSPVPWTRSGRNAPSRPTLQHPSPRKKPQSLNSAKAQLIWTWRCKSAAVHMHKPRKLPHPDSLHVLAAQGWLELGNHLEANEELEKIAASLRSHPDVLEVRWPISAKAGKWEVCLDLAQA